MKLMTLNIWGGKLSKPLLAFIKKYGKTVDIFCFQEVFHQGKSSYHIYADADMNIFTKLSNELPDHKGYFTSPQDNEFGLAIFIRRTISIEKLGETFVFRWKNARVGDDGKTLGKHIQYIQFRQNSVRFTIVNFHGLWIGGDKNDTPDRIKQSENIVDFMKTVNGKSILAGDYNLLPNTKSMKLLEKQLRNLISEYNVETTRNLFYTRPEKYADYILVSPDINVIDFKVLPDVVSDHLPLFMDFNG